MTKEAKPKIPQQQRDSWRVRWPEERGATTGDFDLRTLHAAVGLALSQWEKLEEELARLFAVFVRDEWAAPAIRAYGSVSNFHGRYEMLNAAAEAFFHAIINRKEIAGPDRLILSTKQAYKELIKLCKNFCARRNDIAHGRDVFSNIGFFLKPALYNSNKYDFEDKLWGAYSYTSVEIIEYSTLFNELTEKARGIQEDLKLILTKIS